MTFYQLFLSVFFYSQSPPQILSWPSFFLNLSLQLSTINHVGSTVTVSKISLLPASASF